MFQNVVHYLATKKVKTTSADPDQIVSFRQTPTYPATQERYIPPSILTLENLSSGFLLKPDSNQSSQLQRLGIYCN